MHVAVSAALQSIGNGARRIAYERHIPLHLWRHSEFRIWLTERRQAGHSLTGARVLWLQSNNDRTPVRWVLNAQFQHHDQATKSNEFIAFGDVSHAH